jgi:hypothetical protein
MRKRNNQENILDIDGLQSQKLFEGLFPAGHKIKVDLRTPEDVALGAAIGDV